MKKTTKKAATKKATKTAKAGKGTAGRKVHVHVIEATLTCEQMDVLRCALLLVCEAAKETGDSDTMEQAMSLTLAIARSSYESKLDAPV